MHPRYESHQRQQRSFGGRRSMPAQAERFYFEGEVGTSGRMPRRGFLRSIAHRIGMALQRWADRGAERLSEAGERVQEWSERGAQQMSRGGRQMGEAMRPARYGRAGAPGMPRLDQPGPYAGRGPKGYHRSDERIAQDVCDVLAMGHVDPSDVEVAVEGGEVTLRGTIPDRESKRLAEDMVEWTHGVRDVHNELRVQEAMRPEQHEERHSPYGDGGHSH